MAFDGTDPCWVPDLPTTRKDEWRLRIAQFGDGYEQRTLDGINPLNQTWSLVWENREAAVLNAMVTYLYQVQAHSFLFAPFVGATTYRVFCDSWQTDWTLRRRPRGGSTVYYGTLSAEFRKANGVTV
jgi:phage-related protein